MLLKTQALVAAALLVSAAAPKSNAPKATAAKPAATRSAPVRPQVAPVANFDARNPASVVELLNAGGGKAAIARKDPDAVLVLVTSVAANFSLQFAACDAQGRGCKAVQFDSLAEGSGPTFAQLNAFNQTSALCRGTEDKTGKPHVLYSTLLFPDDTYDHFRVQMEAWTGCIGEFRNFLKDPNGYLASAP
ncbi:hypothetical protein [Phenylobacterium sp.]|jgi:hypothetical protein|uniref:hypothetical protein n=1 Tax=Phenylobacterium sp. TaxID=1871053 RepID=UPI002F419C87